MEVRETIRFDANSTDDNYIVFKLPIGATSVISSDAYNLGGADVWTGPTDSICYVQNFAAYAGGVIVGCAQSPVKRSQLGVSPKPYYISMFYTVQIVGWTTTTPTNED